MARRPRTPDAGEATPLWRYVTYPIWLELLRTRSLHFTRVDRLEPDDPYEGRFLLPREWAEIASRSRAGEANPARSQFAVSCWCAAQGERMSLWERYAAPFGVAMETTLGRLRRALSPRRVAVRVAPVVYAEDPALASEGGLDILRWMLRKRRAFEDEQEIRAVTWSFEAAETREAWPSRGVDVGVDPRALVRRVWVGPPWERWFHEQVRDVSRRLGFPASRVERSTLMDLPLPPPRPIAARGRRGGRRAARVARRR